MSSRKAPSCDRRFFAIFTPGRSAIASPSVYQPRTDRGIDPSSLGGGLCVLRLFEFAAHVAMPTLVLVDVLTLDDLRPLLDAERPVPRRDLVARRREAVLEQGPGRLHVPFPAVYACAEEQEFHFRARQ